MVGASQTAVSVRLATGAGRGSRTSQTAEGEEVPACTWGAATWGGQTFSEGNSQQP